MFVTSTLNYTLKLPNASMDAVTFTDTYPMQTGQISFTADGRSVGSGSRVTVPLDADQVTVTVRAAYVWHTEVGSALYTVQVISPASVAADGIVDRAVPRLFLRPGFRLGARWNRLGEAVKTRKQREQTGKKWARYGLKGVKESGSPGGCADPIGIHQLTNLPL